MLVVRENQVEVISEKEINYDSGKGNVVFKHKLR